MPGKTEFIKNMRLEKGLTRTKLAEMLGISREHITEWEKDDKVPFGKERAWKKAVGLNPEANLLDIQLFGSEEAAEAWFGFMAQYLEFFAEGGGQALMGKMEEHGVHLLFEPLLRLGFKLPALPIFNGIDDEDEAEGIFTYASGDDHYFFDSVLNEFLLWHENYHHALFEIQESNEICQSDYAILHFKAEEYIWANLFSIFVDLNCLADRNYFGNLPKLFSGLLQEGNKKITEAWNTASTTPTALSPTWSAADLIAAASSDISAMLDFGIYELRAKGLPMNATRADIIAKINQQGESISALHRKVDKLMEEMRSKTKNEDAESNDFDECPF